MFNLVLNTQIMNNTVVDNNYQRPAAVSIVAREDRDYGNFGTSVIGAELRGNSVTGHIPNTFYSDTSLDDSKAVSEGINLYWQWQTVANFQDNGTPSILGTVVQGNSLTNSAAAFVLNTGDYHTALVSNATNNVGSVLEDQPIMGASHASVYTVTATSDPQTPPQKKTPVEPTLNAWTQLTEGTLPSSVLPSALPTATSFLLAPSVAHFGGGGDSFSMLARLRNNDTELMARISIPSASDNASAGAIVFRASTASDSPFVSVGVTRSGNFFARYRLTSGGSFSGGQIPVASAGAPLWVRLGKLGSVFRFAYSLDGITWNGWGDVQENFDPSGYIAALETSSDKITEPSIFFDNVSLP